MLRTQEITWNGLSQHAVDLVSRGGSSQGCEARKEGVQTANPSNVSFPLRGHGRVGPGQTAPPVNAEIGLEAAPPYFLILLGAVHSDPAGDRQEMKTELRVGISGPDRLPSTHPGPEGTYSRGLLLNTAAPHPTHVLTHTCTHALLQSLCYKLPPRAHGKSWI